ncbi:Chalcone synthase [Madurella fahalii]|uniref:Chalcone synthase n=1 Tax=Madurella fahalii TaxID=1157608 RepID=A0ABQ0GDY7_9PEZI
MAAQAESEELGLSILGLGTQYPPHSLKPDALDTLSKLYYPDSPAMRKVLSINRYTGIDQRSSIGTPDHPLVNQPAPPTIADLHKMFMSAGVPLAVSAARKALAEAHVDAAQVTHMVSTTCTDSANPGYDHFVARELCLNHTVEKVLLHGVGCSGGLAALRTAANLCLGHTMQRKPARILVVALEISTTLVRSELESIHDLQETRIGATLFSDCASAVLLSNDIPMSPAHPLPPPIYSLLTWTHQTIPSTESDLGFDVDPAGWKVVLSPRIPQLTQSILQPSFAALLACAPTTTIATLGKQQERQSQHQPQPSDFDWAMHPGGATILTNAERALGISPEHMRASYDTYINHGNSSSATIFSVLDRLRHKDMDALAPGGGSANLKEHVVGCAFGPGITVEMCLLRRNLGLAVPGGGGGTRAAGRLGMETPPETESEASAGSEDGESEGPDEVAEKDGEVEQRTRRDGDSSDSGVGRGGSRQGGEDEAFISEALEGIELD